ncbi:hypothetical protein SDC9_203812 [bioreactor metagenome]|uniref:Uncharacterized protein n=1 Tax=bioreactor metagenome TaxID=1076179 RepID=A0A645IY62_9ZZZZ
MDQLLLEGFHLIARVPLAKRAQGGCRRRLRRGRRGRKQTGHRVIAVQKHLRFIPRDTVRLQAVGFLESLHRGDVRRLIIAVHFGGIVSQFRQPLLQLQYFLAPGSPLHDDHIVRGQRRGCGQGRDRGRG